MARTDCEIVIEAPREFVWEKANDLGSWTSLFSEYSKVDVIAEGDNRFVFRLTMYPDSNGMVWSWVSERTLNPDLWSVSARRIECGPFDHMNIEWEFNETPAGTSMQWVQEFSMKPEAPMNDEEMAEHIVTNSRVQMCRFKKIIERQWRDHLSEKEAQAGGALAMAGDCHS